jgi:hypothetical protein
MTVPLGTMPGYSDLTIGGLVATGAHGFGGQGNSNVVSVAAAPLLLNDPCCMPGSNSCSIIEPAVLAQ